MDEAGRLCRSTPRSGELQVWNQSEPSSQTRHHWPQNNSLLLTRAVWRKWAKSVLGSLEENAWSAQLGKMVRVPVACPGNSGETATWGERPQAGCLCESHSPPGQCSLRAWLGKDLERKIWIPNASVLIWHITCERVGGLESKQISTRLNLLPNFRLAERWREII